MSIIYPGNYVAQLNAYRGQGVEALPGVNFYSVLGVAMLDVATVNADGTPATYALGDVEVLSPDLRQDDKPRLNKPAKVPAGSTAYFTAVSTVNIKGAAAETISAAAPAVATVLTAANGVFPPAGATDGAALDFTTLDSANPPAGGAITVTVGAGAALEPIDVSKQAYVILEVASYGPSAAPTSDDVHVPFKVEAGQGT